MKIGKLAFGAVALVLSGCAEPDTEVAEQTFEQFEPGRWEVEETQESLNSNHASKPTVHEVTLAVNDAALPMPQAFENAFYSSMRDKSKLRFANGRIEGSYSQSGVDDLPAIEVPVIGTYSTRHFDVSLDFEAYGMTLRQTLRGRLVQPAT